MPTTFNEKLNLAYVNVANYVATLPANTPNLALYKKVALQLAQGGQSVDWFVRTDMTLGQGYDDTTPQATIEDRLKAVLLNLITLGFGA